MSKEPIMEFKSQEELDACLKEWQERLFLMDWTIKAVLCEDSEMPEPDCLGYCWNTAELKAAKISILKMDDDTEKGELIKPCHEKVLIHELMHCKRLSYRVNGDSVVGVSFETSEHAHIEEMAKALLMAKYNLTFDWFKNF